MFFLIFSEIHLLKHSHKAREILFLMAMVLQLKGLISLSLQHQATQHSTKQQMQIQQANVWVYLHCSTLFPKCKYIPSSTFLEQYFHCWFGLIPEAKNSGK